MSAPVLAASIFLGKPKSAHFLGWADPGADRSQKNSARVLTTRPTLMNKAVPYLFKIRLIIDLENTNLDI